MHSIDDDSDDDEDNAEPRRRAKERTREIEATIAHERANRGKTCVGCGKAIEPDAMRGTVTVRIDAYDSPEQHTGKVCSFDCVGLALRSLADAWDAAAPCVASHCLMAPSLGGGIDA